VACCSVSIYGASLSRNKVSAASGVPCCHVLNTGGSLSCNSVWLTSVVEFCCILTSGGHLSCINVGVSLSFVPSTVAGCSSAGVVLLWRVVVDHLAVVTSTLIIDFFDALVLGRLGLLSGVSAPVAVQTARVTPRLLRRTEAAVWMTLSLSLDDMFQP
jgi:hypothetical protein